MGRETQLHLLPKDVNQILVAMHDKERQEVPLRIRILPPPEHLRSSLKTGTYRLWSCRANDSSATCKVSDRRLYAPTC